ncbi:hypothetical protein DFH08DRAFT_814389 [Mycena albidolilacea]|uniref:Uncharacterized protein n=1 Tax=Mycena albidolilacea TaxID=1033008 RepID=A0AAD6ZPI1_9AGAR|nr:hypothetical protein DFH08DRAFT_814389 [Mycena albidolilacea]
MARLPRLPHLPRTYLTAPKSLCTTVRLLPLLSQVELNHKTTWEQSLPAPNLQEAVISYHPNEQPSLYYQNYLRNWNPSMATRNRVQVAVQNALVFYLLEDTARVVGVGGHFIGRNGNPSTTGTVWGGYTHKDQTGRIRLVS